jgi:hypothetical protein
MTPVRSKHGRLVHLTADLRNLLCGRRVKQMLVEPDAQPDCPTCVVIATTN